MEKYQTLLPRFGALILDGILLLPLEIVDEMIREANILPPFKTALIIFISLAGTFYFILMHGFFGQTVGKMLMRVRVLNADETPLKFYRAILRDTPQILFTLGSFVFLNSLFASAEQPEITPETYFGNPFIIIVSFWGLADIIFAVANEKRRALHDYIAGSVVVKVDKAD